MIIGHPMTEEKSMILQPIKFDPAAIVREIDHIGGWGQSPRTTFPGSPHKDIWDIVLRGPVGVYTSTIQELHLQVDCEDYTLSLYPDISELVGDIYTHAGGKKLGRIILAKLPPGKVVTPHCDEGPVPEMYTRYHAIVQSGHGSWFLVGREAVEMLTGEVWIPNVQVIHAVVNLSDEDRIHLIIDIQV